ncbi:MAG: hypothetical protein ACRDZ7_07800 [Acidimicrobiia bacterium]
MQSVRVRSGEVPVNQEGKRMGLTEQAPQVGTRDGADAAAALAAGRVLFAVKGIYGLSKHSIRLPLNERESIESGQICATADPDADPSCNLGVIDFERGLLTIRYGAQAIFPGLYQLLSEGRYDPGLLHPVRAVATDQCTLTPDYRAWRALGCLEFLPGSIWSGADGG